MRRPGPHRLCKVSSEASARAVHVAGATAGDLGQGERGAGGEAGGDGVPFYVFAFLAAG